MYFYASAWNALAGEVALFGLYEDYFTIDSSMDGEVAAHESAWACNLGSTGLADEYFASLDLLATKALDAKSLAGIVV